MSTMRLYGPKWRYRHAVLWSTNSSLSAGWVNCPRWLLEAARVRSLFWYILRWLYYSSFWPRKATTPIISMSCSKCTSEDQTVSTCILYTCIWGHGRVLHCRWLYTTTSAQLNHTQLNLIGHRYVIRWFCINFLTRAFCPHQRVCWRVRWRAIFALRLRLYPYQSCRRECLDFLQAHVPHTCAVCRTCDIDGLKE